MIPIQKVIFCFDPLQYGTAPSKRGVGVHFGPDVTEDFLSRNNLGKFPFLPGRGVGNNGK